MIAKLSQEFAARLLEKGIYVIGFYYPSFLRERPGYGYKYLLHMKWNISTRLVRAFEKIGKRAGVLNINVYPHFEEPQSLQIRHPSS
jgi:glycine C-acetyltransferase